MRPLKHCLWIGLALAGLPSGLFAEKALTWQEIKDLFEAANPTLRAGQIGLEEARSQEITTFLRPNPDLTTTLDQIDTFSTDPYRPLGMSLPLISASYLHERQHKRELRLESAQKRDGGGPVAMGGSEEIAAVHPS
jgi:outer membrane protein, heavy metal efflux system